MNQGQSGIFRWATMGWLVLSALAARGDIVVSTSGSLFNPGDAAFAGATQNLSLTSGSITFNTDSGAITGSLTGMNPNDYFFQGQSQSGKASLGVFVFDSINLPQGVTITVTGSQGLVLASRHDLSLGTTLNVNGGNAPTLSTNTSGTGGSGAPGGGAGGKGGFANTGSGPSRGTNGQGTGGGKAMSATSTPATTFGGGGGGYGDKGGSAANSASTTNSLGGASYGTASLTDLFGGSGGGGSQRSNTSSQPTLALGGGGGGGGAVELISLGTLTLSGSVEAKGGSGGGSSQATTTNGAGGGGSGGGILLAANRLVLSGSIDASGGNSGALASNSKAYGGGGGGGRIALYYNTLSQSPASSTTAAFGTSANSALNGLSGTTYNAGSGSFPFQPVSTPELSSFCLAMIGALPVLLRRRPH